jgi:hypothetical protein
MTAFEAVWQHSLDTTGYPPSIWTTDLDGDDIIVCLQKPLGHGKWEATNEDGKMLIVSESNMMQFFEDKRKNESNIS